MKAIIISFVVMVLMGILTTHASDTARQILGFSFIVSWLVTILIIIRHAKTIEYTTLNAKVD